MSITKEVKTGVMVAVALVILFLGFYFLKGANLFSSEKQYYCFYTNVDGLQTSAYVMTRGLNVGHVSHIELVDNKEVKVTITINKSVEVPQGTVASLASGDLLGAKVISLDQGKGPGIIEPGATLPTIKESGLVDKVSEQLTPRLAELKETISLFNTTLTNVNTVVGPDNQKALADAIASIKNTADNLAQLSATLNKEGGEMTGIIHNVNNFTGTLAKNDDTIQHILANASNITRQLANAPIQKTISDLQKSVNELHGVLDKINNNQGSLGMLINNKDVYNNLNSSLQSLNSLMSDIKAHPSRYINLTVFGSSSKK